MNNKGLGCLESLKDLRDYIFNKNVVCSVNYPERFELTNLPRVKNQKTIGSCVAHATSSILEYHSKGSKLSTNFIYGIRKKLYKEKGKGMSIRTAVKIVYNYGDMLEDDLKGNTEVDEVFKVAEEAFADKDKLERAINFSIEGYTKLRNANDIKYALMNYGPVLASLKWYDEYEIKDGIVTFNTKTDYSGHAVMIYGWNENGWLIQNSWGKSWGNNGRFICSQMPREAYSVIETGNEKKDIIDPTYGNKLINIVLKIISAIVNALLKR